MDRGLVSEFGVALHSELLGHTPRRSIVAVDDGGQHCSDLELSSVIDAGQSRLGGEPLALGGRLHMKSDLKVWCAVDGLPRQPAVAEELTFVCFHDPQSEPVFGVIASIPADPLSRLGAVFGVRVILHHSQIAEEGGHIVEIVVGHLPQAQTGSVAGRHEFRITGRADVRGAAGVFSLIGVAGDHE